MSEAVDAPGFFRKPLRQRQHHGPLVRLKDAIKRHSELQRFFIRGAPEPFLLECGDPESSYYAWKVTS